MRPTHLSNAIDPSEHALAVAGRRADRLGRPVTLIVGDAAALPYRDDSFDTVIGTFVLCSVADIVTHRSRARGMLVEVVATVP